MHVLRPERGSFGFLFTSQTFTQREKFVAMVFILVHFIRRMLDSISNIILVTFLDFVVSIICVVVIQSLHMYYICVVVSQKVVKIFLFKIVLLSVLYIVCIFRFLIHRIYNRHKKSVEIENCVQ